MSNPLLILNLFVSYSKTVKALRSFMPQNIGFSQSLKQLVQGFVVFALLEIHQLFVLNINNFSILLKN
jgi:hypothetical protein